MCIREPMAFDANLMFVVAGLNAMANKVPPPEDWEDFLGEDPDGPELNRWIDAWNVNLAGCDWGANVKEKTPTSMIAASMDLSAVSQGIDTITLEEAGGDVAKWKGYNQKAKRADRAEELRQLQHAANVAAMKGAFAAQLERSLKPSARHLLATLKAESLITQSSAGATLLAGEQQYYDGSACTAASSRWRAGRGHCRS